MARTSVLCAGNVCIIMPAKTRMLSRKLAGNAIQCLACRRGCKIAESSAGYCGVRANENGKLVLMVYGRPCSVQVDPIEKKPLYHFLPGSRIFSIGTFGCNFSCSFCQNWDISQAPQEIRQDSKALTGQNSPFGAEQGNGGKARQCDPKGWNEHFTRLVRACPHLPPEEAVLQAQKSGCRSIAFTYNEPTIFTEYAIDVMKIAKRKKLKGVYVTNGYATRECWDRIAGLIDAANIDLKAFNQSFYTKICKVPDLEGVKDSIAYAKKKKIWVEVTTLLVPGQNDSAKELREAAEFLRSIDPEMPWHITAYHPDYNFFESPPTPPESLIKARNIGLGAGLKHVYCGNVSQKYSGFETTFCAECSEPIIRRDGFSVLSNSITAGKCGKCGSKVSGIWA